MNVTVNQSKLYFLFSYFFLIKLKKCVIIFYSLAFYHFYHFIFFNFIKENIDDGKLIPLSVIFIFSIFFFFFFYKLYFLSSLPNKPVSSHLLILLLFWLGCKIIFLCCQIINNYINQEFRTIIIFTKLNSHNILILIHS